LDKNPASLFNLADFSGLFGNSQNSKALKNSAFGLKSANSQPSPNADLFKDMSDAELLEFITSQA